MIPDNRGSVVRPVGPVYTRQSPVDDHCRAVCVLKSKGEAPGSTLIALCDRLLPGRSHCSDERAKGYELVVPEDFHGKVGLSFMVLPATT